MMLYRHAREYYTLAITTVPVVASWEASFDDGATWAPGTPGTLDGTPVTRWLIAGPDAPTGETVAATLTGSVTPLVRATDNPEVIVRPAPIITLS